MNLLDLAFQLFALAFQQGGGDLFASLLNFLIGIFTTLGGAA